MSALTTSAELNQSVARISDPEVGAPAIELVGTIATLGGFLYDGFSGPTITTPAVKIDNPAPKPMVLYKPADIVLAKAKKGPKDLVEEAKAQKQQEAQAAARAAKRQATTAQGKNKEGESNQGTRGSHNSGGRKRGK